MGGRYLFITIGVLICFSHFSFASFGRAFCLIRLEYVKNDTIEAGREYVIKPVSGDVDRPQDLMYMTAEMLKFVKEEKLDSEETISVRVYCQGLVKFSSKLAKEVKNNNETVEFTRYDILTKRTVDEDESDVMPSEVSVLAGSFTKMETDDDEPIADYERFTFQVFMKFKSFRFLGPLWNKDPHQNWPIVSLTIYNGRRFNGDGLYFEQSYRDSDTFENADIDFMVYSYVITSKNSYWYLYSKRNFTGDITFLRTDDDHHVIYKSAVEPIHIKSISHRMRFPL